MRYVYTTLAVAAMVVVAPAALANSIVSSTIHFSGTLTDAGGGVYTGTILATAGTYYIAGGPGTHLGDGSGDEPNTSAYYTPDHRLAVG